MSDPHNGGGKSPPSPGTVFAYVFLGGLGIGLGFYLFALFFGMGVEAIGIAQRHYPQVVMGLILIGAIIAFVASSKSGGGGDHH